MFTPLDFMWLLMYLSPYFNSALPYSPSLDL